MESAYDLGSDQNVNAIDSLLRAKEILVERAETVWKALRVFQNGTTDFADCLIERSAVSAGCERTMTFDRRAAKGCGTTLVA